MRKLAWSIVVLVLAILLLLVGAGIFLYYKGPDYALQKATEFARTHFQTELGYKRAGFIGQRGFWIEGLEIRQKNLEVVVPRFQVLAEVDWQQETAELQEVLFEGPVVKMTLESTGEAAGEKVTKEQGPSALEGLILQPPVVIKPPRLKFRDLSLELHKIKKILSGPSEQLDVKSAAMDMDVEFVFKRGSLKPLVKMESHQTLSVVRQKGSQKIAAEFSRLKVEVEGILETTVGKDWIYGAKNFAFDADLTKGDYDDAGVSAGVGSSKLSLKTEARFQGVQSLEFEPDFLQELRWKFRTELRGIRGEGAKVFQWIPQKGAQLDLATEGRLQPATPTPARFDWPWTWEASVNLIAGPLQMQSEQTRIKMSGHFVDTRGRILLETTPRSLLRFQGNSEFQKEQTQFDGSLLVNLPPKLTETLLKKDISGSVKVPLHLVILPGSKPKQKEISFETVLQFNNLSYLDKSVSLIGLKGEVPFAQKIIFNPGKSGMAAWSFKEIITPNPFERADYERLDPLIRSSESLTIQSLGYDNRALGPFKGALNFSQNLLSIHSFTLEAGAGSASGEMYVDLNPGQRRIGFLGRLTQLDLAEILPAKYLKNHAAGAALPFSARTGMVFSVHRKNLSGRMDVTQIGGRQLTAMINVLDPNFEDNKMNKIRSLLQLGQPTNVSMAFHDGMLDLALDIEALGLKTHQSLSGLSIQSFINKALEGKLPDEESAK